MKEFPKISLKAARINANLSQREAAKRLNINTTTLHNYESGETLPDIQMVQRIEGVYQFPADLIFFNQKSRLKREKRTDAS